MLFYTKKFLLLWIISFALHFKFRNEKKIWPLLLAITSCIFYAKWDKRFLLLMIGVAFSDYILAMFIEDCSNLITRKKLVTFSIVINLIILGFFKYFNFFINSAIDFVSLFGFKANVPFFEIVLPIGISFYTFESLSYVIEVYRGHMKASRNFNEYFLFVAFFPHLVAGPIIQPKILIEQFRRGPEINESKIKLGLWRFALGLSKKLLLADQLAYFLVDPVFTHPIMFNGLESFVGVIAYSFQIYFDFSGYSDMALGLAQIYGFELPENFNFPYLAQNIREFWRRWHISLSTWLRDYLYISLGGNRGSNLSKYRNIFLTMLLGGIWHGASYNFVIWGTLHGIFITLSHALNDRFRIDEVIPYFLKSLSIISTFLLVSFAWIFFRAENVIVSKIIISNIFNLNWKGISQLPSIGLYFLIASFVYYLLAYVGMFSFLQEKSKKFNDWAMIIILVTIIGAILIFDKQYSPFIYFQF